MSNDIKYLFLQGNYKKIMTLWQNNEIKIHYKIMPPEVLASFLILGYYDEAKILFDKNVEAYSGPQKAFSYFYFLVSAVRSSNDFEAKKFIFLMHQLKKKHLNYENQYFLYQALAFYNHMFCKYKKSYFWTLKAYARALKNNDSLGEILSSDLLAHGYYQMGELDKAIDLFKKTRLLAKKYGQKANERAIYVNEILFNLSYSVDRTNSIKKVEQFLQKEKKSTDTYSKSNIYLELSKQHTYSADLKKSFKVLEKCRQEIFKFGHRRQKSLWYFRAALNFVCRCQFKAALDLLEKGKSILNKNYDLLHLLQILSLEFYILNQADASRKKLEELKSKIIYLSQKIGSFQSNIILNSIKHTQNHSFYRGEFLNYTLEQFLESNLYKNEFINYIFNNKLFYFLDQKKILNDNKNAIILDLIDKDFLIFQDGSFYLLSDVSTFLNKKLLQLLSVKPRTKENLVNELWGYQYEPHRHDTLVYTLLSRCRKSLGVFAEWIKQEQGLYFLDESVAIINKDIFSLFELQDIAELQSRIVVTNENSLKLNYRQIKIIGNLEKTDFLSSQDFAKLLKCTKMTICRDLQVLVRQKYILQTGKGKSTRYSLASGITV